MAQETDQPQPPVAPIVGAAPAPQPQPKPQMNTPPPRRVTSSLSYELLQMYAENPQELLGKLLGVQPEAVMATLARENHTALLGLLASVFACDGRDQKVIENMALRPLPYINSYLRPTPPPPPMQAPAPPMGYPPPAQAPVQTFAHDPYTQTAYPPQPQFGMPGQQEMPQPGPGQTVMRMPQVSPVRMGQRVPANAVLPAGLNQDVGYVDADVPVQRSEPFQDMPINDGGGQLPLVGTAGQSLFTPPDGSQ